MTDRPTYDQLIKEVKDSYSQQLSDIKSRVDSLTKNIEKLRNSTENLLVEHSKFQVHLDTKNGNQIHHIPPCMHLAKLEEKYNKDLLNINNQIGTINAEINNLKETKKELSDSLGKSTVIKKEKRNKFSKTTKILTLIFSGILAFVAIISLICKYFL